MSKENNVFLVTYRDNKRKYHNIVVRNVGVRKAKFNAFMEYSKLAKENRLKQIDFNTFSKYMKFVKVDFDNVFKLYKVPLSIVLKLFLKLILSKIGI